MINSQFADKVDMSEVQVIDLLLFLSLTYVNILFIILPLERRPQHFNTCRMNSQP